MFDYQFKTTFWTDFSIADVFGVSAIKDTFNRAFEEWRDNYIYILPNSFLYLIGSCGSTMTRTI